MDMRDRLWICCAVAVAIASVALSAFIVAFAPADPYAPSRAAIRAEHRVQVRESEDRSERAAADNARTTVMASAATASAGIDGRLVYAASGAAAGLALMFAVMGWIDRNEAATAGQRGYRGVDPGGAAASERSASTPASSTRDDEATAVGAMIAMIALGFGAFVGRNRAQPMPRCSHAVTRDMAHRLEERAIALHELTAGYGAAAIEPQWGDNRRRAERRNPFAVQSIGVVERRSAARRITDASCAAGSTVIRPAPLFPPARMDTV